jgi:cytochrome b
MAASARATVRVWDAAVRIGHWTLVACVVLAWFTRHGGGRWHEWAGYTVLAVVALRVLWGFAGSRHARFANFLHSPKATFAYARLVASGREPRHLGHNPLGGWMIVALLVTVALAAGSGWLYTTERFWGVAWVEETHEVLANLLLLLAGIHVAGVVVESLRHRENLVAAMWHGDKRDHDDAAG